MYPPSTLYERPFISFWNMFWFRHILVHDWCQPWRLLAALGWWQLLTPLLPNSTAATSGSISWAMTTVSMALPCPSKRFGWHWLWLQEHPRYFSVSLLSNSYSTIDHPYNIYPPNSNIASFCTSDWSSKLDAFLATGPVNTKIFLSQPRHITSMQRAGHIRHPSLVVWIVLFLVEQSRSIIGTLLPHPGHFYFDRQLELYNVGFHSLFA